MPVTTQYSWLPLHTSFFLSSSALFHLAQHSSLYDCHHKSFLAIITYTTITHNCHHTLPMVVITNHSWLSSHITQYNQHLRLSHLFFLLLLSEEASTCTSNNNSIRENVMCKYISTYALSCFCSHTHT